MADNFNISTEDGDRTIATDLVSGVDYQRVKPSWSADGSAPVDTQLDSTSATGPMPTCAYLATDYLMAVGLGLVPKFAVINLTATGTLVAAVASKKIRVLSFTVTFECQTGDETYTFKSGAAGTAISGAYCDAAAAGAVIPIASGFNPFGHFESSSGVLLELSLAGTSPNAQGCLTYVEV